MAFRDVILDRFWLKLFSFILATLIWFTVTNVQLESRVSINPFRSSEARSFDRTVRLATLPTNRKSFKVAPVTVTVSVRGDRALLDKVRPSDILPFVVINDPVESATAFPVEVKGLPPNVRFERVIPASVTVEPLPAN